MTVNRLFHASFAHSLTCMAEKRSAESPLLDDGTHRARVGSSDMTPSEHVVFAEMCEFVAKLIQQSGLPSTHPAHDVLAQIKEVTHDVVSTFERVVASAITAHPQSRTLLDIKDRLVALAFITAHTPMPSHFIACTKADVDAVPKSADVVNVLSQLLAREVISFPWKRLYINNADAMMTNLREHELDPDPAPRVPANVALRAVKSSGEAMFPLRFDGGYATFVHPDSDYDRMDVLVDLFQERARLNARRQVWYGMYSN